MAERHIVKIHPDKQIEDNIPYKLPSGVWIVSYNTTLFIDGKFVLKWKTSLSIRKDGEQNPEFIHSLYVRTGFLPPKTKDEFYALSNHCYQTAVIEFNKTLDEIKSEKPYPDAQFISFEGVKKMVDNALNPDLN